jgi:hypothetical protein
MYYLVVKFEYEITQQEFLEMAWLRYRASSRWKFALAFGALLLAAGIFFYFFADHSIGLILIGGFVFFMSLNTTVTALSFRRVYRRNSRLFGLRTTTIRDAGFVSDSPMGHTETTWNMYEKFRETKNLFLLYQSADLIGILPKRVFATPPDLQEFRSLLTSKLRSIGQ